MPVSRMEQQRRRLYEMCAMAIAAGRADLDGASRVGFDIDLPVFSVGRAAELAAVHPQTLRQYDRSGLVVPQRTGGGARRYSLRDVDRLIQAQRMSQRDGINLTGIARILDLEEETGSCDASSTCAWTTARASSRRTWTAASPKCGVAGAHGIGGTGSRHLRGN